MRVHLTGSSRNPDEDLVYLKYIIDVLHDNDVSIALNWVEAARHNLMTNGNNAHWDWEAIVAHNMDAINRSDALIIEGTTHGFFQGFQAAAALGQRVPVLFLSREPVQHRPVGGIRHKLLTAKTYRNDTELGKFITTFLESLPDTIEYVQLNDRSRRFLRGESAMLGQPPSQILDDILTEKLQSFK